MVHSAVGQKVPHSPEFLHLLRLPQGDANVFILAESQVTTDKDIVFAKMLRDLLGWMVGFQQNEVGARVNPRAHADVGIVKEFLAIIGIALDRETDMLGI